MLQRDRVAPTPGTPSPLATPVPGVLAGRAWRDITALHIARSVDEVVVPASERHIVLVNVGRRFELEERLDGRRHRTSGKPGDVAVIPAGMSAEFRTATRTPVDVQTFAMFLEPSLLDQIGERAGAGADASGLVGSMGGRDPAIERIAAALALELRSDGPLDDLYAESLATALAAQLLRGHTPSGPRSPAVVAETSRGRLSPRQLRDVTEYIEANLDRDLSLSVMAGVAFLSTFHFARMFRASTGYSPHQFVLWRRVERARQLLATTDIPLVEVAHLAGFADQSHLSRHTRRLLGVTPTELRRLAV